MFAKDLQIIGIAGKIASGKSYVSKILRDRGYQVIDADKIGHDVLALDFVKQKIRKIFGNEVFDDAQPDVISRKKLGDLVFADNKALFTLNHLLFGIVYLRIVEMLLQVTDNIVFVESALLFSSGLDHICTGAIYVDADPEVRLGRLMQRGLTQDKALKRLHSQNDIPAVWDKEWFLIRNNGSEDSFLKEIDRCLLALKIER